MYIIRYSSACTLHAVTLDSNNVQFVAHCWLLSIRCLFMARNSLNITHTQIKTVYIKNKHTYIQNDIYLRIIVV